MDDLNEFLNAKDCLNTKEDSTNSFQFDVNTERSTVGNVQLRNASITSAQIADATITNAKIGTAAIGTANIGTLSFNEISGGTAVLGGTLNGNGLIVVKSQSGGTTAIINFDGLNGGTKGITLAGSTPTSVDAIVYPTLSGGTLSSVNFDALNAAFRFETDEMGFSFYAGNATRGSIRMVIGTGNFLRVTDGAGGTLMELSGNTGNLRIKGTIQQSVTF